MPTTWAVTPLPVSRIPSDQPLTVRKNRDSRSSTSGSSLGYKIMPSHSRKQGGSMESNSGPPATSSESSRAVLAAPEIEPTHQIVREQSAQKSLEKVIEVAEARPTDMKRRSSLIRALTSGFPRRRRTVTGAADRDRSSVSEITAPINNLSLEGDLGAGDSSHMREPSDEVVDDFIKRVSRKRFTALMKTIANRSPPSTEMETDPVHQATSEAPAVLTTLRAAVRTIAHTKMLTQETQDIDIAVEVEGVLHNRNKLPDAMLDVIFVVDNGYYVTKSCLDDALDAVHGALHHLEHSDRVALYTTHCTHQVVSSNKPDLLYPLRPYTVDSIETFRELTKKIAHYGTQTWYPPRPNPAMSELLVGVLNSMEDRGLRAGRIHVILLSPTSHHLHDVSNSYPDVLIHHINPAILPFKQDLPLDDILCRKMCCKNVSFINITTYNSIPGRIKSMIKNARCEKPIGELKDLVIDFHLRDGCHLLDVAGQDCVPVLRLGQTHTFFIRVRVEKAQTQLVDLNSEDPAFNSSLDAQGLRQQLSNNIVANAHIVHYLDVRLRHQNSVLRSDCCIHTETPSFLIRELGGLAVPVDTATEVYKRKWFFKLMDSEVIAPATATEYALAIQNGDDELKHFLKSMGDEIESHQAICKYEAEHRQKLPLCPGPVELEGSAHEWLVALWNRKNHKRGGMVLVGGDNITDMI